MILISVEIKNALYLLNIVCFMTGGTIPNCLGLEAPLRYGGNRVSQFIKAMNRAGGCRAAPGFAQVC